MRQRILFLSLLYFPGTVLHEMSHYFAAKLFLVPTGRISLIPRVVEDGLELGHVEIAKTDFIRRFIVGIAPLISGICVISILVYLLLSRVLSIPLSLICIYLIIAVLNTMTLSKSDLQGSWKIAVLVMGIVCLYLYVTSH